MASSSHYTEIAKVALKRREDAIPKDLLLPEKALTNLPRNLTTVPESSGHFTAEELKIIETNAEDILSKIKSKTWTSLEVTKAFCKAAIVAQQLVSFSIHTYMHTYINHVDLKAFSYMYIDKLPHRDPHPRSSGTS
jgi:hypothetical protein